MVAYIGIFVLLMALELLYLRAAERFNIIDMPSLQSSHTRTVLRGGGIIFPIALWIWSIVYGFRYPWLLSGVTLAAGVSFVDDIRSLPVSRRLVIQFAAMFFVLKDVGLLNWEMWWEVSIALIVCVGATNIYNFMDGINGITGGYSLAVIIPLFLLNRKYAFVEESMLMVIGLSLLVFCFFNFRKKAECFAGDVGSIGIALILAFCVARLIITTGDVTWTILALIYGIDGCLTIVHRTILHENLIKTHRKHAYQLMANELQMSHGTVSSIYMALQMIVSLMAIYVIPDNVVAHWVYFICAIAVVGAAYVFFMRKYYHLHEEYLNGLE